MESYYSLEKTSSKTQNMKVKSSPATPFIVE